MAKLMAIMRCKRLSHLNWVCSTFKIKHINKNQNLETNKISIRAGQIIFFEKVPSLENQKCWYQKIFLFKIRFFQSVIEILNYDVMKK